MSSKTGTMGLTKPDVNDKVADTIADLAANFSVIDALYPVGTIYQSTRPTSPATFIGGTWTALTGRVLVGAGTDFPAGTTGGSATHQLTNAEMPAAIKFDGVNDGAAVTDEMGDYYPRIYQDKKSNWEGTFSVVGGGQAMSLMDPYRSVYMWERTA